MVKVEIRLRIQELLKSGHPQAHAAALVNVSLRTVKRIAREDICSTDDETERRRRGIGRPSVTRPFRGLIIELLASDPGMRTSEILRRLERKGYRGRKSATYKIVASLRSRIQTTPRDLGDVSIVQEVAMKFGEPA